MQSLFNNKAAIIAEDFEKRIHRGEFSKSDKLPSTVELAQAYTVSRETINMAMSQLVNKGLIHRRRGFGSFVNTKHVRRKARPHVGIYLPMLHNENATLSPAESPTWSAIFYGVLHTCASRGYTLIPVPDKGEPWDKIVDDYRLGGILLSGGNIRIMESFWSSGVQNHIKYLLLDRPVNFQLTNYVEEFSPSEICRATQLLINKGHRYIAAVGSDIDDMVYQNFFAGYRSAMTEHNLYSPSYVKRIYRQTSEEYDQIVYELMQRSQPPTLILVFNYAYVGGIIDALERYGLRVPQDISLVVTHTAPAEYRGQKITSFTSPDKNLFGEVAANALLDLLEHKAETPLQINLELQFNQGDTLL